MLGRIETRTRDRIYCQAIRTVRDISRDDRAIIATCSSRTLTDRLKENYSTDYVQVVYGVTCRGRSGKIARPLRSRIAYYYNTRSNRRHQCISVSHSIACEPTSVTFKKQKTFFGF